MIDRRLFAEGLAKLCVAFNREVSDALIAVYYEELGDYMDDSEWTATVGNALWESEFFPTIKKLAELYNENVRPPKRGLTNDELRRQREEAGDRLAERTTRALEARQRQEKE